MDERIRFETPENIEVSYEAAGLGTRFTAWMIDQFLVTIITIALFIALLIVGVAGETVFEELADSLADTNPGEPPELTLYVVGFFYLVYSLGSFFYFGLTELLMRGQTIGKRKLGVRVVQADGFALRPGGVLVRTIFRAADHLPPMWVVPLVSQRSQRLGDLVAGTVVVTDDPEDISDLREQLSGKRLSEAQFQFTGTVLAKARPQDVETVERLLERLSGLRPIERATLLPRIVDSLCGRLGVERPTDADSVRFLQDFLAAEYHREYRRLG